MACGVQVVEALTPKPMTSIDVAATRQLWAGRVAIWGGIPSVMLTPTYSDEEFERCMRSKDAAGATFPADNTR